MTLLPEGYRLGPYRIVRLLGEGGMGAVYEARQDPLDRRVALKTLHREGVRDEEAAVRFFNEAKTLSRLTHPSIVQVSDFGSAADGTPYLVMEYLPGQSLGRRLAVGDRCLRIINALQLAWQVADVLAVAHAQGIVHRDLKPDNLMLVADPVAPGGERVKVLDFGIAKLMRAEDRNGAKTDTAVVMGTPLYMSPEQCGGAGGVDEKTDVYSLGCVLYEMLSGRPPFVAEGAGNLIGMHLFQTPPTLLSVAPSVPPHIAQLVHRMLTKNKGERASMSAVADDIGRILSELSGTAVMERSQTQPLSELDGAGVPATVVKPLTTLGQSSGERKRLVTRRQWIAGASLSSLGLVGVTVTKLLRTPKPRPKATPNVRWSISTNPKNAAVVDEQGQSLGTTPWTQEQAAASGTTTLHLRRDGYNEALIRLDRAADANQSVTLTPIIPAALPSVPSREIPRAVKKTSRPKLAPSKHKELPLEP